MTPSLIRAARGLLNWQQSDLAKAAGLSLSAVNNYERGLGKTRVKTVEAITATCEKAGIEFLPNGGVRHAEEIMGIHRLTGADFISKMNDDIYASMRASDQEIYTCSTDERRWFTPDVRDSTRQYFKWRAKMGIKELFLVSEENALFADSKQNYRVLPANLIGKITYVIYADRIALINWRKKQVFILRGNQIVDPFREQFKFLWRQARKV